MNTAETKLTELHFKARTTEMKSRRWRSKAEVPIVTLGNHVCNVSYFMKSKNFRVFWPLFRGPQQRKDFTTADEVIDFARDELGANAL